MTVLGAKRRSDYLEFDRKDRRKRKRLLDKYETQDTSNEFREQAPDSDDDTPEKIYEYKTAGQRKTADIDRPAKPAQAQAADQQMQDANDRFTNLHKKLKITSEEEEIENKDVITTKEIDQVLQATKELLTRRINFTPAKKKDSYETAFDNMTPLNKEKTVFEFKTKKMANQAKTANGENGNASSVAGSSEATSSAAQKSPAKGPVIDEDRSLLEPPYSLYPIEKVMLNMKWKSVSRVGSGLVNHGNTCFMNAALQCLLYTPALANLLLDRKTTQSTKFNALDEMSRLIKVTNAGNNVTSPKDIAYNLKAIGKFRLGRQEDSHEFIINLLDKMENCVLSQYGNKLDKRVAKTNVINQIFGGYLRSQIKSMQSNYISNTYDPFVDLSLQLTKGTSSIESALREYVTPDVLDGDNKYKCPLTKKYVKATKTLTIDRAPPVLVIHLKRFDFLRRKITKHIQFSDVLNLAPYMSDTKQQATYHLHGVLVHQGSTCNSGHYYSFIKASNNIWYEMDDQSVSQVSLKTVLKQNAYILFYSREYTDTDLKRAAAAKFKETVAAATTSKEPTPAPQKPAAESKSAPSTPAKSAKASTPASASPSKLIVPPSPAAEKEKAPSSPKAAPKQQTPPSTPSSKTSTSKSPNGKISELIFDSKHQNGAQSQSSSQDSVPPSPRPQGSQDIISHEAAERKIDRLRSRSKNGLMSPVTPGAASVIRKKILGLMEERIKLYEAENPPSPMTPSKANLSMEERLNKALGESKSDDIMDDSNESTTQESPKSSPKGSPTKTKTTPFDPRAFIKQMNDQYGEEVDAWDEETAQQKQEILAKQQTVMNGDKKRKSEWEKLLDRGKVKKVRVKRDTEAEETWTDGSLEQAASNPFQQASVRRQRNRIPLGGR